MSIKKQDASHLMLDVAKGGAYGLEVISFAECKGIKETSGVNQ